MATAEARKSSNIFKLFRAETVQLGLCIQLNYFPSMRSSKKSTDKQQKKRGFATKRSALNQLINSGILTVGRAVSGSLWSPSQLLRMMILNSWNKIHRITKSYLKILLNYFKKCHSNICAHLLTNCIRKSRTRSSNYPNFRVNSTSEGCILWAEVRHMNLVPWVVKVVKNPPAYAGDARDKGSIPWSGRSPGEGNGLFTPVFLPGKSHGQRSLVGYSPWSRRESDRTVPARARMHARTHPHTHPEELICI